MHKHVHGRDRFKSQLCSVTVRVLMQGKMGWRLPRQSTPKVKPNIIDSQNLKHCFELEGIMVRSFKRTNRCYVLLARVSLLIARIVINCLYHCSQSSNKSRSHFYRRLFTALSVKDSLCVGAHRSTPKLSPTSSLDTNISWL